MTELQAFYDAVFPHVDAAIGILRPVPARRDAGRRIRLLQIVHSFAMVSFPVEVWLQPEPVNGGIARIDRHSEPFP